MSRQRIKRTIRREIERTSWGRNRLEARRERLEAPQRQRGVSFYKHFLDPGQLCFDVGANVGNRTRMFRELGARVVAAEPQASCVDELNRRFGQDSDVVIVPQAVGDSPGSVEIAVCDEDTTISTISDRWQTEGRFADRKWTRRESVPVTTLDALINEYGLPSFCKIDVEGFEKQVLRGLSSPLPCISFEFALEFLDEARACIAVLEGLGPIETTVSFGDTMRLGAWTTCQQVLARIEEQPGGLDWGDIYVRSTPGAPAGSPPTPCAVRVPDAG